jgi:hypothetical protein
VTGNYVVGSVDFTETLNPPECAGLSTGTINNQWRAIGGGDSCPRHFSGKTITTTADPTQARAFFRDTELDLNDGVAVRKSHPGSAWQRRHVLDLGALL